MARRMHQHARTHGTAQLLCVGNDLQIFQGVPAGATTSASQRPRAASFGAGWQLLARCINYKIQQQKWRITFKSLYLSIVQKSLFICLFLSFFGIQFCYFELSVSRSQQFWCHYFFRRCLLRVRHLLQLKVTFGSSPREGVDPILLLLL